jgi:hypothetical protein
LGDRIAELLQQAAAMAANADGTSLWRAYVAVECAILDLKLRYGLEGQPPPPAPKRTAKKEDLVAAAKEGLARLDAGGDRKKLLYDLRVCRDALKAALAKS